MRRRELIVLAGGAALAWPLVSSAKPMPVIGLLALAWPSTYESRLAGLRKGLAETGYIEGQNVAIEYHWAEGSYDRLPALAADLVRRNVDVIVAGGPPAAGPAKNATSILPIVFVVGDDPVATGLVASMSRPGGNLTGVSILTADLMPKRLQLLSELIPRAGMIALLGNPTFAGTELIVREVQAAARAMGMQVSILMASTGTQIDNAFASLANLPVAALVVAADPFFNSQIDKLVESAALRAIPAMYIWREFVAAGGLISYGPSIADAFHQAGIYVGKILKGTKPADLPVVQPTKFELVINLKTAKALGLAVPQSLLARADEVIE